MIKDSKISNYNVGELHGGYFLVRSHSFRETKGNPPKKYLDITISDISGEINCKMWDISTLTQEDMERLKDGAFVAVQLLVDEYNGAKQGKIQQLVTDLTGCSFDKSKILPTTEEDPDLMYDYILHTVNNFKDEDMKKLVLAVLEERGAVYKEIPGAKSVHHSMINGLILHIYGMLNVAQGILAKTTSAVNAYEHINEDLLYSGVILHDICKIDEFQVSETGLVEDYTQTGKLLGHLHMGAAYIERKCDELNVREEVKVLLSHMLLSHHGQPDFGSPVRPMFLEASLLNFIDMIDSRVAIYSEEYNKIQPGTFGKKNFLFDGAQPYRHNL